MKRTSAEGKKAFEQGSKAYLKQYYAEHLARLDRAHARAVTRRDVVVAQLKASKVARKSRALQMRVGERDRAIATLSRQIECGKAAQKAGNL